MTATASAHARFGTRLAALAAEDGVLGPGFERLYARFHPHRDPFATLVLRDTRDRRRILRVGVSICVMPARGSTVHPSTAP